MSGLRERKKAQTRATIREHALRLFLARGFDPTTVQEIADAAGVSAMTFFRHFPTKEAVVADDDYDPLIFELIVARPAGEAVPETTESMLVAALERRDARPADFRMRVLVAASLAALETAVAEWAAGDGGEELPALVDTALSALV